MSKKVLILSASPRKGGNSDLLCGQFAKGAEEAGHQVEKIRVQEKKIAPCLACYGCRGTGICVQRDDMAAILDKMVTADVLVLATPVYFSDKLVVLTGLSGSGKSSLAHAAPVHGDPGQGGLPHRHRRRGPGSHGAHRGCHAGLYRLFARRPGEGCHLRLRRVSEGRGHGHQSVPGGLPAG